MKKIIMTILIILVSSILIFKAAGYIFRSDSSESNYDYSTIPNIEYLNKLRDTHLHIDGHYFDPYLKKLNNVNYIDLNKEIPYENQGLNIYLYNIDRSNITPDYFNKLVNILRSNDNTLLFMLLGTDYSFLGDNYSFPNGSTEENNKNYINDSRHIIRVDHHLGDLRYVGTSSNLDLADFRKDYYFLFYSTLISIKDSVEKYYVDL